MDWIITESNLLSPQDIDRQGNKLLIGNGYIGYRGTLEEFTKDQKTATIVSGLYDQVGDQWREPVNLPNGGFVQVYYQGEPLHALNSKILEHTQSLDMQHAIHERCTVFEAQDGAQITVRARRFASLAEPHLICMEYSVSVDRTCAVDLLTGIDGDVWDINGPHLQEIVSSEGDGILSLAACTHESSIPIAVSESIAFPAESPKPALSNLHELRKSCAFRKIHTDLAQDKLTFYKFFAHFTGQDGPNPLEASRQLCQRAAERGFDVLLLAHNALWEKRWDTCDIQIDGDAPAQQALRFSMYHLLAIAPAHSSHASIPARGLSGQVYKGAIFWDTEIFMLPFFNHTFPGTCPQLAALSLSHPGRRPPQGSRIWVSRRILCLGEPG